MTDELVSQKFIEGEIIFLRFEYITISVFLCYFKLILIYAENNPVIL